MTSEVNQRVTTMASIGSYRLGHEIGRGGMGVVYQATHAVLGRQAAVKVLLAQYTRDPSIVQRFFNEARAASAIRHPGIVEIYDFGVTPTGDAYIVMELLEGESLGARLQRVGCLGERGAVVIARQIASALAAAHRVGIVHRDLKPDNVFLVPDAEVTGGERVKLLDFGIAKLAIDDRQASQTTTGLVIGTPSYMSPEQCAGSRHIDGRADLYALGCVMYRSLAGRLPFEGDIGWVIGAHQHLAPSSLAALAPEVTPSTVTLVERLLSKAPGDRPASGAEVVDALREGAGDAPSAPEGPGRAAPTVARDPTTLSAGAGGWTSTVPANRRARLAAIAAASVLIVVAVATAVAFSSSHAPAKTPAAARVEAPPASPPHPPAASPPVAVATPPELPRAATPPPDDAVRVAATPPIASRTSSPVRHAHTGGVSPAPDGTPAPVPRPPPPPSPPSPPPSTPPVVASPPVDAAALVDAAVEAARADRYSVALDRCQRALAASPPAGVRTEALDICVRAACRLKTPSLAARYLRGLEGARRASAIEWCRSFGMGFDP